MVERDPSRSTAIKTQTAFGTEFGVPIQHFEAAKKGGTLTAVSNKTVNTRELKPGGGPDKVRVTDK